MGKIIQFEICCDNKKCGYTKEIPITKVKLGMKCDKCGAIVINKTDMDKIEGMKELLKIDAIIKKWTPNSYPSIVCISTSRKSPISKTKTKVSISSTE
jgi:hypothetical protein